MKFFLKNKLFFISFILFLGLIAAHQSLAISLSPAPNSDNCIGSGSITVSGYSGGCGYDETPTAAIDGSSCNAMTCQGVSDGPHSFSAGCSKYTCIYEQCYLEFQKKTEDISTIIDAAPPAIHSFELAAIDGKGSIANDVIASGVKKISGEVKISVTASDKGVDSGCGKMSIKIYVGRAAMEDASHAPKSCGSYEKLTQISPNPKDGSPYEWTWNTNNISDNRYYCLKAEAYDGFNHSSSVEKVIIINNKCDQDNDGFVNKEKFDLGCQNVVCPPSDWTCQYNYDCNDNRDKGGYYARPYDSSSAMDYMEGQYSPPTFYYPTCVPPKGCPACDDLLDNDCDDGIDLQDSNCFKTCDADGDNYYTTKCLRIDNWENKGDCNDNDKEMNYGYKESFDNLDCVKINCCMDGKDNDCDGQIDDCNFKKECDKDNDEWLSKDCSPESSSQAPPEGYLGWGDCDDNDPNAYPGKKETEYIQGCDGTKDNNCDGTQDKKDLDCIMLCDKDEDGFFNFYDKNYKSLAGHNDLEIAICGGRFDQEPTPSVFSARENGTGDISPGKYSYKVTFVTPQGETSGSQPAIAYIASSQSGNKKILLENIPTGNPITVTARKIYRTKSNGSEYKLLTTLPDNTTYYYEDNTPDSELQDKRMPGSNTTGQTTIKTGGLGLDTMDVPDPKYPDVNPKEINSSKKEKGDIYKRGIDTNGNDTVADSDPKAGTSIIGGLVPCGRGYDDPNTSGNESEPCTICHFFYIFERIITFVRNLAFIVAPVLIVVCGILFITSSGNVTMLNRAKQGMIATVVGIVIILSAWVLVTLLFKTVGSQVEGGSWYEIQCQ